MDNFNSTETEKVEAEKVEAEKVETEKVETEESGARVPLFAIYCQNPLDSTVLVIVMALGLGVGVILSNWIIGLTAGVLVGIIAGTITLFFRKK